MRGIKFQKYTVFEQYANRILVVVCIYCILEFDLIYIPYFQDRLIHLETVHMKTNGKENWYTVVWEYNMILAEN